MADVAVLLGGLVTAVVTARWLGPAGKGALSALLLIGHVFLFYSLALGLGDAAVFLVKGRDESIQRAVSATLPVLAGASLIGIAILLGISIPADWSGIAASVVVTGIGLSAWIHFEFFTGVLNAQERIPLTSFSRALASVVMALATVVLVGIFDLGVLGGTIAALIGVLLGVLWLATALHRDGVSFRPKWDPDYIRAALRFGIPSQAAFLLLAVSQRFDQLIVYSLLGEAQGGLYSVSLTLGWLITFLPAALSRAAFPRLAQLSGYETRDLLAQMLRVNAIASATVGVLLAASLPIVVPILFGAAYRPSILPALLLLIAGFIWSVQWTLSRSAAARGRPGLLLVILLVNFVVMLALDLTLIPRFGIPGAAYASIAGAASGLVTCVVLGAARGLTMAGIVPRRADLKLISTSLRSEFGMRGAGSLPPSAAGSATRRDERD